MSSGSSVTSLRGRWASSAPRLARRLAAFVLAQFGILFLRLRLVFGDRLLEGFEAQLQLFFRQTFGPGTELHPCQFQQQMA